MALGINGDGVSDLRLVTATKRHRVPYNILQLQHTVDLSEVIIYYSIHATTTTIYTNKIRTFSLMHCRPQLCSTQRLHHCPNFITFFFVPSYFILFRSQSILSLFLLHMHSFG